METSTIAPATVTVERLANMHSHLREIPQAEGFIRLVLQGGACVILPMPNTDVPLTTAELVVSYHDALGSFVPDGEELTFVPTAFLTETTTIEEIVACLERGIIDFKVYPRDRTTKSEKGARHYFRIIQLVKEAATRAKDLARDPLRAHLHPEHPLMTYEGRDAEFAFTPIADMLLDETEANVIWEHGTDSNCIRLWKEFATSGRFYVTLTAHHLATSEDKAFGDVRSICKPPLKRELDRQLLVELVKEGTHWVMAGGDDAPHPMSKKHVHQGRCACGAYTAPFLLQLYAHALDDLLRHGRAEDIQTFNDFIFWNASALYGFERPSTQIELARSPFKIPARYPVLGQLFEPFWAGEDLLWSIKEPEKPLPQS